MTTSELRALAEVATPGPWRTRAATLGPRDDPMTAGDVGIISEALPEAIGRHLPLVAEVFAERTRGHPDPLAARNDADYIAALDPVTVIDLLDAVEAARLVIELPPHIDAYTVEDRRRIWTEGLRAVLARLDAR